MADEKKAEDFFTPPPQISRAEAFRQFIWNKQTREFLGRTAKSWLLIFVFYVVLYAFLAGFFSCLLIIFYQTLDSTQPRWQLADSIISSNPGMGFRPSPADIDSSTISFSVNEQATWENSHVNSLNKFLAEGYIKHDQEQVFCNETTRADDGKSCNFDLTLLGSYCSGNSFGYHIGKPCIFLKMNKVYGWVPEAYNKSEVEKNDVGLPEGLRTHILSQFEENPVRASQTVWLSCDGETEDDKQKFARLGVKYEPMMGFPAYFYPFKNQKHYESPLVALQLDFNGTGEKLRIGCRLWARNAAFDRQRRLGSVTFELDVTY